MALRVRRRRRRVLSNRRISNRIMLISQRDDAGMKDDSGEWREQVYGRNAAPTYLA